MARRVDLPWDLSIVAKYLVGIFGCSWKGDNLADPVPSIRNAMLTPCGVLSSSTVHSPLHRS